DCRTPRRYHCQPDLAQVDAANEVRAIATAQGAPATAADLARARSLAVQRGRPRFSAGRYGFPDYAQLAETCGAEIRRGADHESERGAFHDLFQPQREANLRARLAEYTPGGTDTGIIFVT